MQTHVCPVHQVLRRGRGLLIASLTLLAAAGDVQAQRVRGRVLDAAAEPLDLARVQLLPLDRHAVTDRDGTFDLGAVSPGTYTLRVRRLGFRAVLQSITVPLATGEVTVTMRPVPVMLDTVHTQLLEQELPYVFQRMKEHLGAVAFGPDLMKRYPGASVDEVLHLDSKLWQQLRGAEFFGCRATAYIDGQPALPPFVEDWARAISPSSNKASANTGATDLELAGQVRMRDVAAIEVFNSPDFIHEPDLDGDTTFIGPIIHDCKRIVLIWTNGYTQPRGPDSTMHGLPHPSP